MRALEFFLLRDASRAAAELDEERRRAVATAIDASVRDAARARSLWATGSRPEAYRYAVGALGHGLDAARAAVGEASDGLERLVGDAWAARVARAEDACQLALPRAAADLADHHGQLYTEHLACAERLAAALEDRALGPAEVARARRARLGAALALVAGLAGLLLYFWRFDPTPFVVTASAYRTADVVEAWPPENAADHDEMSYWHLPPGETGWLDLTLTSPRDITALRIMNAHDVHADDQNRYDRRRFDFASRQIHVHAYSGDREVADAELELPQLRALDRTVVPLEARGVDRIRIDVESFWGEGGGLAEVEVLP
ncbi:MAG: hypothetical protein H6719_35440 [Sandaracinaceae bacterium]|nr:hypothetical protein [Sandaracinaceae bacterium]